MNGDIRPVLSSHGGHLQVEVFPRNASATYGYGEWVALSAAGTATLNEIAEAATSVNFTNGTHFIAASPFVKVIGGAAGTQVRIDRVGDARYVDGPNTGVLDPVYVLDEDTEFMTRFLFNNSDTLVTPTSAHINDECGMHNATAGVAADRHGVDINGTGLRIVRVLNTQGIDITIGGGTGQWVIFRKNY